MFIKLNYKVLKLKNIFWFLEFLRSTIKVVWEIKPFSEKINIDLADYYYDELQKKEVKIVNYPFSTYVELWTFMKEEEEIE